MKIGRNDPCSCGSEKKYKKCCLLKEDVFDFKITYLQDKSYECQIRLSGENNLHDLHYTIQRAYKWDNDHMFSFYMNNKIWDRTSEFSGNPLGEGTADRLIKNLGLKPGQKFMYVFDYGDEHVFEVEVLSIIREVPEMINPGIIKTTGTPPDQYAGHW